MFWSACRLRSLSLIVGMKRILIDLYKIKDLHSGLGQFSMNFGTEAVTQLSREFDVDLLVPQKNQLFAPANNVNVRKASFISRYFPSRNYTYALWHSLHQFPSFLPNKNTTWLLTIHDLNFLIEKNEVKRRRYLRHLQRNVDRANYITTVSNFSKAAIEKHLDLGEKEVHVIHNGVRSGKHIKKVKPSFMQGEKYFFSIGIFSRKKNFETLLPLMRYFPDYKLVIAGNKDTRYGNFLKRKVDELGLGERIIFPGKVDDSTRQWLYANCEAFLFPSLAEGFGLPVVEAMYEGKPVFLSKVTSLPETGGDLAFYFDDFSEQAMANHIRSKLEYVRRDQSAFEAALKERAGQFNWENCTARYLDLYKRITSVP